MLVLALDTTSEHGGAALYRDDKCLACVVNEGTANYSVNLFRLVERLIEEVRARESVLAGSEAASLQSLRDVELYAVANGPGSFTGIRVGLAAAQAWAKAFERPVRGISVLEAMVEEAHPETDCAVPILDARRGEFYLGLFRRAPSQRAGRDEIAFEPDGAGLVLKPNALGALLAQTMKGGATVTCLAREQDQVALTLRESLPNALRWQNVPSYLVGAIARLALEAHRQGRLQSPAELDAYYIRRSDAELNWRE